MTRKERVRPLLDPPLLRRALRDAAVRLDPRRQLRNPVMFVTEAGAALTTVLYVQALFGRGEAPAGFILAVAVAL
ncbi:MAG: potassium-transporting ATPase subunit B, partial [Candidatus Polarisedimenticolia bacterium]